MVVGSIIIVVVLPVDDALAEGLLAIDAGLWKASPTITSDKRSDNLGNIVQQFFVILIPMSGWVSELSECNKLCRAGDELGCKGV
jgi:hypothetical protein